MVNYLGSNWINLSFPYTLSLSSFSNELQSGKILSVSLVLFVYYFFYCLLINILNRLLYFQFSFNYLIVLVILCICQFYLFILYILSFICIWALVILVLQLQAISVFCQGNISSSSSNIYILFYLSFISIT